MSNRFLIIIYMMKTKCSLLMYNKAIGLFGLNAINIYELSKSYLIIIKLKYEYTILWVTTTENIHNILKPFRRKYYINIIVI